MLHSQGLRSFGDKGSTDQWLIFLESADTWYSKELGDPLKGAKSS
jgi:hypothetical protein